MKRSIRPTILFARLIVAALFASLASVALAEVSTPGRVREVTVYRDQALVTRVLTVNEPAGMANIVVTGLPPQIVPESLSAETVGANRIHAVTFRSEAVGEETRPEVLELDNRIKTLEREVEKAKVQQRIANERRETAGRLDQFTASTGQKELENGVLKFQELRGLTEFALALRADSMEEELQLRQKTEDLNKEIDLLRRKRSEVAVGTSQQKREALIHLAKSDAGPVAVKVRYLVSNVGWSPQYNVRGSETRDQLRVEYNARVRQMSGEDWTSATLSLSTAQPSFASEPPDLKPVRVKAEVAAVPVEEEAGARYAENLRGQREVQSRAFSKAIQSARLNEFGMANNAMELNYGNFAQIQKEVRRSRMEGVSVTYPIDQPVTLPSRSDEQLLPIAAVDVPATFKHVATPILTDFVFESATGRNASATVLLPGPYVSYMNGEFVGRGEIPMVAKGEEFTVGFGVDPQVQVTRELVSREDSKSWGKKVSTFDYKIALSNYSAQPVAVELTDRIPWSDTDKVQVQLVKTTPDPDQSTEERKKSFAKGLMTWDVTVPEATFGEKAVVVTYRYRLTGEFPSAPSGGPAPASDDLSMGRRMGRGAAGGYGVDADEPQVAISNSDAVAQSPAKPAPSARAAGVTVTKEMWSLQE